MVIERVLDEGDVKFEMLGSFGAFCQRRGEIEESDFIVFPVFAAARILDFVHEKQDAHACVGVFFGIEIILIKLEPEMRGDGLAFFDIGHDIGDRIEIAEKRLAEQDAENDGREVIPLIAFVLECLKLTSQALEFGFDRIRRILIDGIQFGLKVEWECFVEFDIGFFQPFVALAVFDDFMKVRPPFFRRHDDQRLLVVALADAGGLTNFAMVFPEADFLKPGGIAAIGAFQCF